MIPTRSHHRALHRLATVAATCIATLVLAPAAAATAPDVDPNLERAYAAEYGVSNETAHRRLSAQVRGAGVVEMLKSRLRDDYAGVWFNHATEKFEIARVPEANTAGVAMWLERRDVPADFVPAQYTWRELVTAKEQYLAKTRDVGQLGALAGIDPASNRVVAYVPESTSKTSGANQRAVRAAAEDRRIVARPQMPGAPPKPQWCSYPHCDRPLRGGVQITNFTNSCSAGFLALHPGYPYFRYYLTAGHCGGGTWHAFDPGTSGWQPIGPADVSVFDGRGDAARIYATGGFWDMAGWPPVALTPFNEQYPITGKAWAYPGLYACHLGATTPLSGESCGTVHGVNVAVNVGGTIVDHLSHNTGCGRPGDSGGPWIGNYWGYGIHSAGVPCGQPNSHSWFQELLDAETLLSMSVITQ